MSSVTTSCGGQQEMNPHTRTRVQFPIAMLMTRMKFCCFLHDDDWNTATHGLPAGHKNSPWASNRIKKTNVQVDYNNMKKEWGSFLTGFPSTNEQLQLTTLPPSTAIPALSNYNVFQAVYFQALFRKLLLPKCHYVQHHRDHLTPHMPASLERQQVPTLRITQAHSFCLPCNAGHLGISLALPCLYGRLCSITLPTHGSLNMPNLPTVQSMQLCPATLAVSAAVPATISCTRS
jgi:hypothetical protein